MIKGDLKKIEQNNYQRQQTWSTSSCYERYSQQKPENAKLIQLQQINEAHHKDFIQRIQILNIELTLKEDQFKKRVKQSVNEKNQSIKAIGQVQLYSNTELKKLHKQDRTKQWASEMQNTIKQIMSDKAQIQQKSQQKAWKQIQQATLKMNENAQNLHGQKKQREHYWQSCIDQLGEQIMNMESIIDSERIQSQEKMMEFQAQILDMQEQTSLQLMNQSKKRQQEHAYLTRLLQNVMNKLII